MNLGSIDPQRIAQIRADLEKEFYKPVGRKAIEQVLPGVPIRSNALIELTKLNGVRVTINPELIELLEETPDTVITMATGRKYLVKESMREIRDKCVEYQQEILRGVQG